MEYSIEYLHKGSLDSEKGTVKNEAHLESLLLKLDAEKYVSLALFHKNENTMTISGGRQQYVVMMSNDSNVFELNTLANRGGEKISIRTGHTIGKFNPEMVNDPFTTLNVIKEFYNKGKPHPDYSWRKMI